MNRVGPEWLSEPAFDLFAQNVQPGGSSLALADNHEQHERLPFEGIVDANRGSLDAPGHAGRDLLDLCRADTLSGDLERVVGAARQKLLVMPMNGARITSSPASFSTGRPLSSTTSTAIAGDGALNSVEWIGLTTTLESSAPETSVPPV